ncbi:MAG: hypothetical protein D6693_03250 [Planctomycetota bacterium]|nr:MAG: hypothetical protein D6693_03250 [Planctomycetota bacterium]
MRRCSRWVALPLLALIAIGLSASPVGLAPIARAAQDGTAQSGPLDRVILKSGQVIVGRVLEETATEVRVLVMVGGISAPTTYRRDEVLSIERGVVEDTAGGSSGTPAPSPKAESSERATRPAKPGAARIYLLELRGDLGKDISATPLRRAMEDAVANDPDVIVIKMNAGSAAPGFDGLWAAEDLGPIVEEQIDAGRRVVFWIERAQSGAAFLPLVSPEIYFTSGGKLGGVGDLSDFDIGDETVNLKQISLRIGHAEGFAITGGYDPRLIRAMALKEEWLAVRFRGGEPEYITWEPRPEDGDGWVVLTDDGEGDNEDEFSFEGNDVLTLDADWAFRLGVAKGVVDTMDDLAFELNIGRDYEVIEGRGSQILKDWRDRLDRALDQINRIQRDLSDRGGRRLSESARLGRQINLLKQLRGILTSFAEVLDPDGSQRASIDIQIEELRQQIQRASRGR